MYLEKNPGGGQLPHDKILYIIVTRGKDMDAETIEREEIQPVLSLNYRKISNSVYIDPASKEIKYHAFDGCTDLKFVHIPEGIEKIGPCAFRGCTNLVSIIIPETVKEIGWQAFSDCTKLKTVIMPNKEIEIGNFAFRNCNIDNLTSDSLCIKDGYACSDTGTLLYCCDGSKQTAIIPKDILSIAPTAFKHCDKLKSVVFANSNVNISKKCFS